MPERIAPTTNTMEPAETPLSVLAALEANNPTSGGAPRQQLLRAGAQMRTSQVLGPITTKETIQRTAPTQMSRREFSMRGMPLDHAKVTDGDGAGGDFKVAEDDDADVAAIGAPDLGGAMASDGLPPPLQYSGRFGGGLLNDIRRKARHYRTDWTDAFLPENLSIVMSTILFIFFACLAPALAFGAIYDATTGGQVRSTRCVVISARRARRQPVRSCAQAAASERRPAGVRA